MLRVMRAWRWTIARWRAVAAAAAVLAAAGCSCLEGQSGDGGQNGAGARAAKFPPAGVDHLLLSIELEVEIFGLGKDTLSLQGDVLVHRGAGGGPDGELMVGELAGANLRGASSVFGDLIALASPTLPSPCRYEWKGPSSYAGGFDIYGWFFLPQHGLVVFNRKPVKVWGPAAAIPPVGQVAEAVDLPVEVHDWRKPEAAPVGSVTRAKGTVQGSVPPPGKRP